MLKNLWHFILYFIFIKNLSNLKYDGMRILAATYATTDNHPLETLLSLKSWWLVWKCYMYLSNHISKQSLGGWRGHDSQIIENLYFSDNLPKWWSEILFWKVIKFLIFLLIFSKQKLHTFSLYLNFLFPVDYTLAGWRMFNWQFVSFQPGILEFCRWRFSMNTFDSIKQIAKNKRDLSQTKWSQ